MLTRLAPVGEPISPRRGRPVDVRDFDAGYRVAFVDSGTSALALAMVVAGARRGIAGAEVILPGYGCPDLVAAARFAGLRPRLVDLAPARPGFDPALLRAAVSERTAAVVAVNFLGIADDLDAISTLCADAGALLIEDDAQWYARDVQARHYRGDLVVHSFGRGKPVSLLGGGALLYRPTLDTDTARQLAGISSGVGDVGWYARVALYNTLLAPPAYALAARLPFLHIGETRYHPLPGIRAMDRRRLQSLAVNLARYGARNRDVQRQLHRMLVDAAGDGFVDLPAATGSLEHDLLRYPLLCPDRTTRDRLYAGLSRFGASTLYGTTLPRIDGVGGCDAGPLPQSQRFAGRLLTLALTSKVGPAVIERIGAAISGVVRM